jgi:hypothetical protein
MQILGRSVVLGGATILGLVACSASNSTGIAMDLGGPTFGGAATEMCTQDAGGLTPIGPQGCSADQTVVYRKPLAGTGASGISSSAGIGTTPIPAMVAACTTTKCGPGQVAVVTYQAIGPSDPLADAAGSDDAAPVLESGAAPVVADGGAAIATDGAASGAEGGAASPPDSAAPLSDAAAPDAALFATADASDDAIQSPGDASAIAIPCGAVVTCVDAPPMCPGGQSPSFAPSGRWHCMPLCNPNDSDSVLITYGASYGNITICASAPPKTACPTQGQVWTWDYEDEEWVCASECNNGQYDQHSYSGQTVCVPC